LIENEKNEMIELLKSGGWELVERVITKEEELQLKRFTRNPLYPPPLTLRRKID